MNEVAYDDWEHQVLPLLRAIREKEDEAAASIADASHLDIGKLIGLYDEEPELAQRTGLPLGTVLIVIQRLLEDGFLTGERHLDQCSLSFAKLRITGQGLRAIGAWPSEGLSQKAVVDLIESIANRVTDPDERTRLGRLKDAFSQLGRDTFVHVSGELAKMLASKAMGM